MNTVDCRGQACPGPVIAAKKALETAQPGAVIVIEVDSEAGRDNVRRFAESKGAVVSVARHEDGAYRLAITAKKQAQAQRADRMTVVFITGDVLGTGDEKLGRILMEGFVRTLLDQETPPDKLLLMNGGVRLAVDGSPLLPVLRSLTDGGCEVLSCGTCLDFFGLKGRLAAGSVSSMLEIQGALLEADSVIRV